MHDNIKSHAIAPAIGEVGKRHIVAFHILLGPLQQCFLCGETLFIVVALYYDFLDLMSNELVHAKFQLRISTLSKNSL